MFFLRRRLKVTCFFKSAPETDMLFFSGAALRTHFLLALGKHMFAKKIKQTRFLFLKRSLENEKNINRARSSPGNHSSKRKFETQTSSMRNNVLEKKLFKARAWKSKNRKHSQLCLGSGEAATKNHLTPGLANVNKFKYMGLGMRAQFNMVTWCII